MIKIRELVELLAQVNIPLAYSHFNHSEENPAPSPPFMVYKEEDSNNFGADNKVYKKFIDYSIELYTDSKDLDLEEQIEKILDDNEIFYDSIELYISTERLLQKVYTITLTK